MAVLMETEFEATAEQYDAVQQALDIAFTELHNAECR
jgi:hypothetical protein